MSTIRVVLRTDKANEFGKCPIELIYQVSGQRKKIFLDKRYKLHSINWDATAQKAIFVKPIDAKKDSRIPAIHFKTLDQVLADDSEATNINDKIASMLVALKEIETRLESNKIPYSAEMVINEYNDNKPNSTKKMPPKKEVFDFIDTYIQDHEHTRAVASLKIYRSLNKHLQNYKSEGNKTVSFENTDYGFMQSLQAFLIKEGKLNNGSIAKSLKTLKQILNYAKLCGYDVNEGYKDFKLKSEALEVITLTETEFKALLALDLSENKRLDKVKDIFCFSCASGLRVSDMQQLSRDNIKADKIVITVQKTKTELKIPLNAVTAAILDKYKELNKPLPMISSQRLNDYIKEVCKLAGINSPIEIVRFYGQKREAITYPKYELIHLHTGRKTFCTLSLERGMSAEQVMSISGHSDYTSFKRYINVTEKLKEVVMHKAWGEIPKLKVV